MKNSIYLISNEHLSSYNRIYDFKGKDVVTVAGSGDQYLTCKLYGANTVDVFDYNKYAKNYLILKITAIKLLDYPDFYRYYMVNHLNDYEIYQKIRDYLADDIRNFFDRDYFVQHLLRLPRNTIPYGDGLVIPYFDIDNYNKLREILLNEPLPTFIHEDIQDLNLSLDRHYDIMLASNIYDWLYDAFWCGESTIIYTPTRYAKLLNLFDVDIIQAHYSWKSTFFERFTWAGMQITEVPSVDYRASGRNYVYSYSKKPFNVVGVVS